MSDKNYVFIVFEKYGLDDEWTLMEVFDRRKDANAYIRKKDKEYLKRLVENPHYYNSSFSYEIIKREVL